MFRKTYNLITYILLFIVLVSGYFYYDYNKFNTTPISINSEKQEFTISPGDSLYKIVGNLEEQKIILGKDSLLRKYLVPYYSRLLIGINNQSTKIKVGDYKITNKIKPQQLFDMFTKGSSLSYKIKFLEGWRFKKIINTIKNNKNIIHTLSDYDDFDSIMQELGYDERYEGMFFPDTYLLTKQTRDTQILKQSYELMEQELNNAWEKRDKDTFLKTPYDLLKLASIIEKETYIDKEKSIISGVFHRRIKKRMKLQTDPTVIYGMGDSYKGKLLYSDLKYDTPHNTYTRKGLPITPISMPGRASLLAAAQPDSGSSLFFVANGSGGHKFTDTYKEHLTAVAEYRKIQNEK